MKYFGKKLLVAVISIAMAVPVGNVFGTTASAATFLQGDVNGDGIINSADATIVNYYLTGMVAVDGMALARMDCDNDLAITRRDYNLIMNYISNVQTPSTVNRGALVAPENNNRVYRRYDVEQSTELSTYTLSAAPPMESSPAMVSNNNEYTQYYDTENTNVVRLCTSGGVGSGFIVDDHVIATAAHCVIGDDRNFIVPTSIDIYDAAGLHVIDHATPLEIHVPYIYYRSGAASPNYSFDYALIYVEENLGDYGKWSLGISTNDFLHAQNTVTSTGFANVDGEFRRYFSTGVTIPFGQNNSTYYKIESTAQGYSNKEGGPTYFTTDGNNPIKSVVGINSMYGANGNVNLNTISTRILPPIIRFYLCNEYL